MRAIVTLIIFLSASFLNAQFINPDKWTGPRNYHTQISKFIYPVNFSEIKKDTSKEANKRFSPNKAYFFYIRSLVNGIETDGLIGSGDGTFAAYIYNEKKLIKMETRYYKNFGGSLNDSYWINEKLIFFRWWLGRIVGVDIIYDVEAEKIIYSDRLNAGGAIYRDYQIRKNTKK